jgi:hypothetical protein
MYGEKIEADHERAGSALGCYEENKDAIDITEEQQEDKSRLEKRISDYIRVLRPGILVVADEAIFEHELLAGLQYHRATPRSTIESLIDDFVGGPAGLS